MPNVLVKQTLESISKAYKSHRIFEVEETRRQISSENPSYKTNLVIYRTAQNFGGRKLSRIWRLIANPPKFYPPKICDFW